MGFYSVHACTHAIIIVCIYKKICVAVDRTDSACTAARFATRGHVAQPLDRGRSRRFARPPRGRSRKSAQPPPS